MLQRSFAYTRRIALILVRRILTRPPDEMIDVHVIHPAARATDKLTFKFNSLGMTMYVVHIDIER